ncbi:MAG TPA: ABC transporter permease [Bacillota bacterium]|nr:ABC transporter permease [Bacillota bacterium]
MMFLTKLAFKNLARHRNRTLITASIIAVAILFYIFLDSMIGGMVEMSYETIIDYESGHLQVVDSRYWERESELPLEHLMELDEALMDVIRRSGGYHASSPELSFQARLTVGSGELPVIAKGVRSEDFVDVFALEDKFVEGSMFASGQYQVVLGKRLADLLDIGTGDYLTLLFRDKNKSFNTIDAEVVGLVHTSNPNVNQNTVFVPLDLAQEALGVDGQVSKLIVRLNDKGMASQVADDMRKSLAGSRSELTVYPWDELEAFTYVEAQKAENLIILGLILRIAAIAIVNTVILAALERTEEIGMMKALGLQNSEVIYTFALESTGIGILGGVVGVVLGLISVGLLSKYGMDFESLFRMDLTEFGIPVIGRVYGTWNPSAFVMVFLFGVIVSLLASILPAYWAADKDPVKSIYHR